MANGNYSLTATAQDDRGVSVNSSPIAVKVSKALKAVRNSRRNSQTIGGSFSGSNGNSASSSTASTSELLDSLTSDIEQTYRDFSEERFMFTSSAEKIDNYLYATLFLVRSSAALSRRQNSTSSLSDRVKKADAYLSFCEDLMSQNTIAASTITAAAKVNAWTKTVIGQPNTRPLSSSVEFLTRNGTGRILSTSPLTPLTSQSGNAPGNQTVYELAGVSVSINGRAVALQSVSPTSITFNVPNELLGGLGEVIVTAQDGYISQGTAGILGLNPIILADFLNMNRGAVVDGLSIGSNISTISATTFGGSDRRTRMAIWASGISTGLTNLNTTNDTPLPDGTTLVNLAESVSVEARLSDGRVVYLPVEFAGATRMLFGADQINVILQPELVGAGAVQLTIVSGGVRGNTASVVIR